MTKNEHEQAVERLNEAAEALGLDMEELVGQAAGGTIFGMVRAMVDRGVAVGTALRLAAFLVVDGSAGRGAVEAMGLSDRAARQYRADIRRVLADVEDEAPPAYLAEWAGAVQDRMRWAAKEQGDAHEG